jgi:hypothetical protein
MDKVAIVVFTPFSIIIENYCVFSGLLAKSNGRDKKFRENHDRGYRRHSRVTGKCAKLERWTQITR